MKALGSWKLTRKLSRRGARLLSPATMKNPGFGAAKSRLCAFHTLDAADPCRHRRVHMVHHPRILTTIRQRNIQTNQNLTSSILLPAIDCRQIGEDWHSI
jgi:hypothetical protein